MIPMLVNEEQEQIVDAARAFLQQELPLARLRDDRRPVITQRQWRDAAELGLFAIGLPESQGGIGLGGFDEALVMREFGRVVASPSFLAAALAARLAAEAGRGEWALQLASGERRAHLIIAGVQGRDAICVDADLDVSGAQPLYLLAMPDGVALLEQGWVPEQAARSLDSAVALTTGRLDLSACISCHGSQAPLTLHARLMMAAQMVGLCEEARDLTVEYAKTRQQFGVAIGSFQAVKHRCADMATLAEIAWAQVALAAHALDSAAPNAASAVASAKWFAADAAHRCGDHAIQNHGGIGFHAECDVHLFMKRAHLLDRAAGDRHTQARLLVEA